MSAKSEKLLNLPEKKDNDTIIPNDKTSEEIIKQIIGEYRNWWSATKIVATEINDGKYVLGSIVKVNTNNTALGPSVLIVEVYNGTGDRRVRITAGGVKNYMSDENVKTFKSTKEELRAALESAWTGFSKYVTL